MKRFVANVTICLGLGPAILGVVQAPAQTEAQSSSAATQESASGPKEPLPSSGATGRDPTRAQGELRSLLMPRAAESPGAATSRPLPALAVKARIVSQARGAVALLSLGENLHKVTTGTTLELDGDRSVKIISITTEGVAVELQPGDRRLMLP